MKQWSADEYLKHNLTEQELAEFDAQIAAKRKASAANGAPQDAQEPDRGKVSRLPVRFQSATPHLSADAAERVIIGAGFSVFHRGGLLVEPVVERFPTYGGGQTQSTVLKFVEKARMIDLMSQASSWEKFHVREKNYLPCAPPSIGAEILLARAGHWEFPLVSGVITTPTLRHDGSLLLEPGYDPKTQLYHAADPSIVLPHMSERPTRDEALAALELLEELLDEFPFADPQVDKSVALSALMTPVLRAAIDAVPMIAVKSPAYGSGKSFLVNLVSAIGTGAACPVTTVGKDEAETEKRLDAALLKCQPIISLDNVSDVLCSDKLAIAVEQPMVNVRVLGLSKTINIENKACFFATGCNITVRGDMVRRTLLCSIDPNQEAPEKRTFKRNPFAEILAGRGKYIAAVLAVARAYLSAGEPPVTFTKLVSFDAWSRFVQKPLIWLGRADPVRSLETSEDADPDRNAITEVLAPWHEAIGDEWVTLKELAVKIQARGYDGEYVNSDLREALMNVAPKKDGTLDTHKFGNWLRRFDGRIAGGIRLARRKGKSPTAVWRVAKV